MMDGTLSFQGAGRPKHTYEHILADSMLFGMLGPWIGKCGLNMRERR